MLESKKSIRWSETFEDESEVGTTLEYRSQGSNDVLNPNVRSSDTTPQKLQDSIMDSIEAPKHPTGESFNQTTASSASRMESGTSYQFDKRHYIILVRVCFVVFAFLLILDFILTIMCRIIINQLEFDSLSPLYKATFGLATVNILLLSIVFTIVLLAIMSSLVARIPCVRQIIQKDLQLRNG